MPISKCCQNKADLETEPSLQNYDRSLSKTLILSIDDKRSQRSKASKCTLDQSYSSKDKDTESGRRFSRNDGKKEEVIEYKISEASFNDDAACETTAHRQLLPTDPDLLQCQQEIERHCSERCATRRVLTLDMVKECSGIKTDNGIGLRNILAVKVAYPRATAPYVFDVDSYEVFKKFFDPLIYELQNGCDSHEFCQGLAFGETESLDELDLNEDKEVLRVMYSEVISRRNLNDYNLSGSLNNVDRNAIKDLLKTKFREIFSSLSQITIPDEWVDRLNEDLNYLNETPIMNNFPNGRLNMVYRDDIDATLGAIINYDDHLQIVTSTHSGMLGHIFHQMNTILNSTDLCSMDFARHSKYGFITVNPSYLGTGFVIRLHLKLPFICLLDDVEDLYLHDLQLVLIPLQGHRSNGILILTNQRTINTTEEEIFRNINEGYKRLYLLDLELEQSCPTAVIDSVMPVESLSRLVNKIQACEHCKSYTKKFLSDSIINQYSGVTTNFHGLINHTIRANAFYSKSLFPKATDPDSYSTFSRFFNPIILEANGARQFLHSAFPIYKRGYSEKRFKFIHNIVEGFRVRFSRNLEDYAFPMLLDSSERAEIESRLIGAFKVFPNDIQGHYYKIEDINESQIYQFLYHLHLLPRPYNVVKKASYVYRDWPKNRGMFVVNRSKKYPFNIITILVNEDDHIQVSSVNFNGRRVDICYDRAVIVMRFLDEYFKSGFSRKPNYGYLSSNPQNIGCCMRVSAKVFLKYLGNDRIAFNDFCIANNFNYRGSYGSGTKAVNHVYDVSFKTNLNYNEFQILTFFVQRLKDLILEERTYDMSIGKPILEPDEDEKRFKPLNKHQSQPETQSTGSQSPALFLKDPESDSSKRISHEKLLSPNLSIDSEKDVSKSFRQIRTISVGSVQNTEKPLTDNALSSLKKFSDTAESDQQTLHLDKVQRISKKTSSKSKAEDSRASVKLQRIASLKVEGVPSAKQESEIKRASIKMNEGSFEKMKSNLGSNADVASPEFGSNRLLSDASVFREFNDAHNSSEANKSIDGLLFEPHASNHNSVNNST